MKLNIKKLLTIFFILSISLSVYGQQNQENAITDDSNSTEKTEISLFEKNPKKIDDIFSSGIAPRLQFRLGEGISYGQITRIEVLENRSNFVRETFLLGAFFNIQTIDFSVIDFKLQVSAFYPYYNAFNGMRQYSKQVILYAFDLYLGAVYTLDIIKFFSTDLSLGMHYMYQLTDEYHMNYLGLGGEISFNFPITRSWTINNSYFLSYDNANLGTNKKVQPFDAAYQYHISLGVSYSKKHQNNFYYFGRK